MRNLLLKVFIIGLGVLALTACSSKKPVTTPTQAATTEGAAATGVGTEEGFAGESSKAQAPFDQVYYFDFDSDVVHEVDVDSINAQSAYLVAHPSAKVRLEGDTDERGSREYNVALGWRRAKAVQCMLEQQGVSPKQIIMVSYGEEKPVAFGHDEASYQLNRRVNLVYEAK